MALWVWATEMNEMNAHYNIVVNDSDIYLDKFVCIGLLNSSAYYTTLKINERNVIG